MITEPDNQETLALFLLGELPEEQADAIEIRLLEDAALQELLEAVESDLIHSYLRGDLSPAEKERMEAGFLETPARREKLALARLFLKMEPQLSGGTPSGSAAPSSQAPAPEMARSFRASTGLRMAAGLLLLLIAGGIVWQVALPRWQFSRALSDLDAAYQTGRPVEGRLTQLSHAPREGFRAPGQEPADATSQDRARLALLNLVRTHPSGRAYRALGASYLLQHDLPQALIQFEKALQKEPESAEACNDLGVALMASANAKQREFNTLPDKTTPQAAQLSSERALALNRANELFSRAMQLDGSLTAAVFNQALCLEQLEMIGAAVDRWNQYLKLDPGSPWRTEAEKRIEKLKKERENSQFDRDRLLKEFRAASESGEREAIWQTFLQGSQTRENVIVDALLEEFLVGSQQGPQARDAGLQSLALLARAGEIEAEASGDDYTRDLTAFYRAAAPLQLRLLHQARETMKAALETGQNSKRNPLDLIRQSRHLFAQAGSEIEQTAALITEGVRLTNMSDFPNARRVANLASSETDRLGYPFLRARAAMLQANLHYGQNQISQGIRHSVRFLQLGELRKDANLRLAALGQLTYGYWFLGAEEQSLNFTMQALDLMRARPIEASLRWQTFRRSSDVLQTVSQLHTALSFEREAMQIAIEMKRPLQISRSYGFLSELLARMGERSEAFDLAHKGLALGETQKDELTRANIRAHALLRLGHLLREAGNGAEARRMYDECIQLSEQRNIQYERLEAHRGRLRLALTSGDHSAAQSELPIAIALFEQNRSAIENDDQQIRFFESGRDIYDAGIELATAARNDPEEAFFYSERARARALLDRLQGAGRRAPAPIAAAAQFVSQIREQLPEAVQIVQYAALNDALHTWTLTRTDLFGDRQPVPETTLTEKVRSYLESLQTPAENARSAALAKELYEILIAPVEGRLSPDKELFIVADAPLHRLPFSALIDPATGKFLVEKYVITYTPSAQVFLHCTKEAVERESAGRERCLSVGLSVFQQPELRDKDLPSARQEAGQVARQYPGRAETLHDQKATESAVRQGMREAEIIHIATHGLLNERIPEYSGLALWEPIAAARPEADGMLHAWEINRLQLPRARLVVLSACETIIGREYNGEGMASLARAFLAAGAPLVVASLWKVDSAATMKFMTEFHARRTRPGMTSAQALCQTQRAMLKSESSTTRHPSAWAGFVSIGGYTRF
ncbi:MAG: CHAT domain-containing protein [Blastocatellia bacterium]|nr:CHAT domain-containing protein [Blastocatellia bacterium]